jgi:hypothetical protein
VDEVTKMPKYYVICLFTFFKSLACLALQTETIVKKITQPKLQKTINEVTKICNKPGICRLKPMKNKKRKWDKKLHCDSKF